MMKKFLSAPVICVFLLLSIIAGATFFSSPQTAYGLDAATCAKLGALSTSAAAFCLGLKAIGSAGGNLGISLNPLAPLINLALQVVADFIKFLGSLFVTLAAWIFTFTIGLSQTLLTSPAIQTGFSICLALANLGLVIALLIIAVMTILQSETYGVKKLLPKLIIVAVFVNFILIIGGSVIKLADGTTYYFLQQASPDISPGNAANSVQYSLAFVSKFTGALGPQGLYVPPSIKSIGDALQSSGGANAIFSGVGNILFIAIFTLLIAFMLLAAGIMMLIRFVYLGILLVIAPLAVLMSIFPATSAQWQKWCQKFLRWTFFGPILMIFLYIAIFASQVKSNLLDYLNNINANSGSAVQASMLQLQRTGDQNFFTTIGTEIIILGLAFGGLIAANSFGIAFAGTTINGAKTVGKMTKGYIGRKGGSAILGAPGLQKQFSNMQQSRSGIVRRVGGFLQGTGNASRNAEAERIKKRGDKLTSRQNVDRISESMNPQELIYALERARSDGMLSQVKNMDRLLTGRTEEAFKRMGKLPLLDNIEKESGLSLINAKDNASRAAATKGGDMTKTIEAILPNLEQMKRYGGSPGLSEAQRKVGLENLVLATLTGEANGETVSSNLQKISANQQMGVFMAKVAEMLKSDGKMSPKLNPNDIPELVKNAIFNGATSRNLGLDPSKFGLKEPPSPENPQATSKKESAEEAAKAHYMAFGTWPDGYQPGGSGARTSAGEGGGSGGPTPQTGSTQNAGEGPQQSTPRADSQSAPSVSAAAAPPSGQPLGEDKISSILREMASGQQEVVKEQRKTRQATEGQTEVIRKTSGGGGEVVGTGKRAT